MPYAPIFSNVEYIYPGPHLDSAGNLDSRIWFRMPIDLNIDAGEITYIIFPYGGSNNEVEELTIEAY